MTDNSRAVVASVVGAMVGAMAGYLIFTKQGQMLRRRIEPALNDFERELSQLRGTAQKVAGVASEGWRLLTDTLGDTSPQPPPRYPTLHQTSPF